MRLTHYVVVRRDLPFGVILAMVAHAAGESFYQLGAHSSVQERRTFSPEADSSQLSGRSTFDPTHTVAVVLGARNERRLASLPAGLRAAGVPHVEIREVEGEFAGQLMAVGVLPGDGAALRPLLNDFQMFRALEPWVPTA